VRFLPDFLGLLDQSRWSSWRWRSVKRVCCWRDFFNSSRPLILQESVSLWRRCWASRVFAARSFKSAATC